MGKAQQAQAAGANAKSRPPGQGGLPKRNSLPLKLLGLVVAVLASAVLSADHLALFAAALPGCGASGGCDSLTSGPFGHLPGTDWPLSFLGLMYFCGLLAASWGAATTPLWLRRVATLGALASLGLIGVMLVEQTLCPWCLATHLGNLVFTAALLGQPVASGGGRSGLAPFGVAFAVLGLALGWAAGQREQAMQASREQRLLANTADIVRGSERRAFPTRWVLGPADAPIRVVVFSDYECPWCRNVEKELSELVLSRGDVSASMKHFPLSQACQPDLPQDSHPNSCLSARAAEAAGLLGGNDAFWAMHAWLFGKRGRYERPDLLAQAAALGLDGPRFAELVESQETLGPVQADVADAHAVGIRKTPMVFINGVELTAWDAKDGLAQAVAALAQAQAQGAADVEDAVPLSALHKSVEDWRGQPMQRPPFDPGGVTWGADEAQSAVDVVLFGDLTQSHTRELYALIEAARGDDVSVRFMHNPVDQTCGETLKTPGRATGACRAALIADAAARLGGGQAYYRACLALLTADTVPDDETLAAWSVEWGLDPAGMRSAVRAGPTAGMVSTDIQSAAKFSMNRVPMLFVNGRWAPRWRLTQQPDAPLLAALLDAARAESSP